MPEHKNKFVQAEIKAMLELGVIEESHSAWWGSQMGVFGSV